MMEPMGPGRRSMLRRKRPPADEEETPFPARGELPSRRTRLGTAFLVGASLPLLLLVLYFAAFYSQGRRLVYDRTYPPGLFKQVVDGKSMDEVLELLGPPARLGPDGDVRRWIYEAGAFDLALHPYLLWTTPIMKGKIVYDLPGQRAPRRVLIRFGEEREAASGRKGAPPSGSRGSGAAADVEFEF